MKQGQKFSRQRVIALKQAMLRGASDTALARIERCSALTIRRMRLGETYAEVVVEGEEGLRPPIEVDYVPTGEQLATRTEAVAVAIVPDEEVAAMEGRLLEHQERVAQAKVAVKARLPTDKPLNDEELREQARAFGAG